MGNQQITFGGIKLMALRWDRGPNPFRGRLEVMIGYEPLRILFFPCTERSAYFLDCDAICSGGHQTVLNRLRILQHPLPQRGTVHIFSQSDMRRYSDKDHTVSSGQSHEGDDSQDTLPIRDHGPGLSKTLCQLR